MNRLRFYIAICCVFLPLVFWNFYSGGESPSVRSLQDSELLFESKVFSHYVDQLQAAVDNWDVIDEKLITFKNQIMQFRYGGPTQNRLFYETFVKSLREYSTSHFHHGSDQQFIDRLVVWFFQGPSLLSAIARELPNELTANAIEPINIETVNQTLNHAFFLSQERSKSFRRDQKSDGKDDPIFRGNIPFRLFTTSQNNKVLRFPNVVGSGGKVVDEFQRYLKVLQSRNQRHLYVNLLSYGRGRADEISRRRALEKLENNPLVNQALMLMTLDKDSEFYWQKKHYANIGEADAFIKAFESELFKGKKSLYKWPRQITGSDWNALIRQKITCVHHRFFEGKAMLSVHERQDFIELVHLALVDEILRKCNAAAMNITCKYSIDRGPSMLEEFYFWELARNRRDLSEDDVHKYAALLTEAPLLFHSRPAHQNRIERTQRVIEKFFENN